MMRFTKEQLEELWYQATTLPAGEGTDCSLTASIIREAMEGGDCDDAAAQDADVDAQQACEALYKLARDIEDFANVIVNAAQEGR
jgi:hypothetical protein